MKRRCMLCERPHRAKGFCLKHYNTNVYERSARTYLIRAHGNMENRVFGRTASSQRYPALWQGKDLLAQGVFVAAFENDPAFLRLFRRYVVNGRQRKLAPSVNRIDPSRGYTLDNIEWVTLTDNSGMRSNAHQFQLLTQLKEIFNVN